MQSSVYMLLTSKSPTLKLFSFQTLLHNTLNFNTDSGGEKMHRITLETLLLFKSQTTSTRTPRKPKARNTAYSFNKQ